MRRIQPFRRATSLAWARPASAGGVQAPCRRRSRPGAGRHARDLSHGDQRRVEIAVCMALAPRLLMLDEPTQGMSPSETAEFDALIKSLPGRVTILLIEH